jgi:hypothetical protein
MKPGVNLCSKKPFFYQGSKFKEYSIKIKSVQHETTLALRVRGLEENDP